MVIATCARAGASGPGTRLAPQPTTAATNMSAGRGTWTSVPAPKCVRCDLVCDEYDAAYRCGADARARARSSSPRSRTASKRLNHELLERKILAEVRKRCGDRIAYAIARVGAAG